jgi:hypothetical protein
MKLIAILLLISTAAASAQLIDTAKPEPSKAQLAADSIVDAINNEITHRVAVHKTAWETLWKNEREGATPEAILAAMGDKAALVFAFSRANLEHIAACAKLVGKAPTDFLPAEYWSSPREITFHKDGSASLKPSQSE